MSLESTCFLISLRAWQKGLSLYYKSNAPFLKMFFYTGVVLMMVVFLVPFFIIQKYL